MNDRLGAALVRDGYITESQLDDALRDQVITGGRLGSNLVELGYLTADDLVRILSRHFGLPVVDAARLEATPPGLFGLHARRLALYHQTIPLGADAHTVDVAMVDPGEVTAREAVEALTRRAPVVHVVPETLFWGYVEKRWGLKRPERVSLDDPARRLRRRDETAWHPEYLGEAPEAGIEADGSERGLFDFGARLDEDAAGEAPVLMSEIYDALARANDRHEVGEAARRWSRGRVEAFVILVVDGDVANGWTGRVPGLEASRIGALSIPLDRASAFHEVVVSGRAFQGAPPESLLQGRFHAWMGRATPTSIRVTPVRLGERIVNLLYADAGDEGVEAPAAQELDALASAMARAYARLIREMRER